MIAVLNETANVLGEAANLTAEIHDDVVIMKNATLKWLSKINLGRGLFDEEPPPPRGGEVVTRRRAAGSSSSGET